MVCAGDIGTFGLFSVEKIDRRRETEMAYQLTGVQETTEKIFSGIEAFIEGFRTGQEQTSTQEPTPIRTRKSSIVPTTILGIETKKFLIYTAGGFVVLIFLRALIQSSPRRSRRR